MSGRVCNAKTIDDLVGVQYHLISAETATPADDQTPGKDSQAVAGPADSSADTTVADSSGTAPAPSTDDTVFDDVTATDHDLEMIVYGAYTGAYNQALKHNNYFESDDLPFADLRTAVRDALEKEGYGATTVPTAPVASAADAKACATDGHIDLRFAFNNSGVGVVIAAVSDKRMSAYEYDPSTGSDLVITHADDCLAAAPAGDSGASSSHSTKPDRLKTPAD